MILVGFAAAGYLSTALIRLEAVPQEPYGRFVILKASQTEKHRRQVKYDVSTLDARFAKKVTGPGNDFPRHISVLVYGSNIQEER